MKKKSAGILPYRKQNDTYEVFLVHPGGPFWAKKDLHSWSVTKGEFNDQEEPFKAAIREFKEETSFDINGDFLELNSVKQPSGKILYAWAVESNLDAKGIKSNFFELEWPPKSGKVKKFPEVDKAEWFSFEIAKLKILKGQIPILEQLAEKLGIIIQDVSYNDNSNEQLLLF